MSFIKAMHIKREREQNKTLLPAKENKSIVDASRGKS